MTDGFCPRCGTRHPLSDFRREWTGQRVCPKCYDPRNRQELVRGVPEHALRDARPYPESVFLLTDFLLLEGGDPFLLEDSDLTDLITSRIGLEL